MLQSHPDAVRPAAAIVKTMMLMLNILNTGLIHNHGRLMIYNHTIWYFQEQDGILLESGSSQAYFLMSSQGVSLTTLAFSLGIYIWMSVTLLCNDVYC